MPASPCPVRGCVAALSATDDAPPPPPLTSLRLLLPTLASDLPLCARCSPAAAAAVAAADPGPPTANEPPASRLRADVDPAPPPPPLEGTAAEGVKALPPPPPPEAERYAVDERSPWDEARVSGRGEAGHSSWAGQMAALQRDTMLVKVKQNSWNEAQQRCAHPHPVT